MKTREFIERVEDELGYVTGKSENYINIRKEGGKFGKLFAMVAFNKVLGIDTSFHNFTSLDKHEQDLFFNLILEYARTPLEEREEERRYVYELPVLDWSSERLCLYKTSHEYKKLRVTLREDLMDKELLYFTDKEVEQYTGKERALFNACERIEVTP